MKRGEIRRALEDDVFDLGLDHFGHSDYNRDYLLQFSLTPHVVNYRLVNCVVAEASTTLTPELWERSLDDNLIGSLDEVVYPVDGWVWATRYGDMCPGATLLNASTDADVWSAGVGIPFYEVHIVAPPIRLRLIFSDLVVETDTSGEKNLAAN